jgi:hypothetical protein
VILGYVRDEPLAESLAAIVVLDREEQNVAVASHRREADKLFLPAAVEVEIDCRATVGVLEEAPALSEDAVVLANGLLEVPGDLDVAVLARAHLTPLHVNAHYLRVVVWD